MLPDYFEQIRLRYLEWIKSIAFENETKVYNYSKLLDLLNNVTFTYILPMDSNLYEQGIYLRKRYSYFANIPYSDVDYAFNGVPCSLLEMMVSLAFKCEENIMYDPEKGDQTYVWFEEMLRSTHLLCQYDSIFDEEYCIERITNLLNRNYEPNGDGGLFTVPNAQKDFRNMEIWYQMHQYLIYLEKGE